MISLGAVLIVSITALLVWGLFKVFTMYYDVIKYK